VRLEPGLPGAGAIGIESVARHRDQPDGLPEDDAQPLSQLPPAHAGEADVEQRQLGAEPAGEVERRRRVVHDAHVVSETGQRLTQRVGRVGVVVDDEDAPAGLGGRAARGGRPRQREGALRHERQLDDEGAAPPRPLAARLDAPAVQLRDRPHDGEAESEPALGAVEVAPALDEQLEDARQERRVDAAPVVLHLQPRRRAERRRAQPHMPAGGRVLDGVGEEVRDHLRQPLRIGVHDERALGQLHAELVPRPLHERTSRLQRGVHRLAEVGRPALQLEPPARHPRHVEQVVDEPDHVPDLPLEHGVLAREDALAARPQELQHRHHGRERVPELMAEHGEELVLGPARLLGPRALAHRRLEETRAVHRQRHLPPQILQQRPIGRGDGLRGVEAEGQRTHPAPGRVEREHHQRLQALSPLACRAEPLDTAGLPRARDGAVLVDGERAGGRGGEPPGSGDRLERRPRDGGDGEQRVGRAQRLRHGPDRDRAHVVHGLRAEQRRGHALQPRQVRRGAAGGGDEAGALALQRPPPLHLRPQGAALLRQLGRDPSPGVLRPLHLCVGAGRQDPHVLGADVPEALGRRGGVEGAQVVRAEEAEVAVPQERVPVPLQLERRGQVPVAAEQVDRLAVDAHRPEAHLQPRQHRLDLVGEGPRAHRAIVEQDVGEGLLGFGQDELAAPRRVVPIGSQVAQRLPQRFVPLAAKHHRHPGARVEAISSEAGHVGDREGAVLIEEHVVLGMPPRREHVGDAATESLHRRRSRLLHRSPSRDAPAAMKRPAAARGASPHLRDEASRQAAPCVTRSRGGRHA